MPRLGVWWAGIRDSLWFVPGLMTAAAAVLAWAAVEVDKWLLQNGRSDFYLAFGGGAEGARGVLDAIASTTITVTGVVFSVTIVALQLASSQFTPRVLRAFISDRPSQVVLGVFIGTFTYTLLVLRTVRSAAEDGQAFVPSIAVSLSILLALVSVGFLIFFIHHSARSVQASHIVDRAAHDARGRVEHLFPEPIGEPAEEDEPALPPGPPAVVTAARGGYLQAVDENALFALAEKGDLVVRMEPRIGEFVLPGGPLAAVWPTGALADRKVVEQVRTAFVTGGERTLDQDVEFGLRQLVDIALRALSPSLNDPGTAAICIDRLAEVVVTLGNRAPPRTVRVGADGHVRFVGRATEFARAVAIAFDQIIESVGDQPHLAAYLGRTLRRAAALVPPSRRSPLLERASVAERSAPEAERTGRDGRVWEALGARGAAGRRSEGRE